MTDPHCANCHSTRNNPAPRTPDLDIKPVTLCSLCAIALGMDAELFEEMGRRGDRERKKEAS